MFISQMTVFADTMTSFSRFGKLSAVWTSLPYKLTTLFESRLTDIMPTLNALQLLSVLHYFSQMGVKYEDLKRGAQGAMQWGLVKHVKDMGVVEFVKTIDL